MRTSSHQQYTILEMSESEIFGVRTSKKIILLSQDKRNVPMKFRTLHADIISSNDKGEKSREDQAIFLPIDMMKNIHLLRLRMGNYPIVLKMIYRKQ